MKAAWPAMRSGMAFPVEAKAPDERMGMDWTQSLTEVPTP